MDRITLIADCLTFHATVELEIQAESVDLATWTAQSGDRRCHPFGWTPVGEDLTFRFCPELIAEQTAQLEDEWLRKYLDAVETTADLLAIHSDIEDLDARWAHVEGLIYELGPDSLGLMSDVQLAAL